MSVLLTSQTHHQTKFGGMHRLFNIFHAQSQWVGSVNDFERLWNSRNSHPFHEPTTALHLTKNTLQLRSSPHLYPGPCLITAIRRCHNPFSQWPRSFQRKLRSYWLKFLWQRHVAVENRTLTTQIAQAATPTNGGHVSCTVLQPQGWDRVAVYESIWLKSGVLCHWTDGAVESYTAGISFVNTD